MFKKLLILTIWAGFWLSIADKISEQTDDKN